jgi:small conductance mechanosensitive channel
MKFELDKWKELLFTYGIKIVTALVVLLIGLMAINIVKKSAIAIMNKGNKDETLKTFLISLTDIGLKIMLFVTVVSMLGIQMASFVAVIGAASLAIGLALQGSLSNLAAGVLILIFRTFVVGEYIEAKGVSGKVSEIQIFHTVLINDMGGKVIIPNSMLSSGVVIIHLDR